MYKIRLYNADGEYIAELWHDDKSPIYVADIIAECERQHIPAVSAKLIYVE